MAFSGESLEDTSWVGEVSTAVDPMADSGLLGLVWAARQLDVAVDAKQVWHVHGKTEDVFHYSDIIRCALRIGLKAKEVMVDWKRLATTPVPFLITDRASKQHYLVQSVVDDKIELIAPVTGEAFLKEADDVRREFAATAVFFSRQPAWKKNGTEFGFSWFIPSILKHAERFKNVLIASLLIQLFALVSPKFFEVVIDRVLVSRGIQSLDVLVIGLLGIAFFEPLMTFMRSVIFAHIASCANAELSARLFRHLVYLPLDYFRSRQAGDIIARVRELDHIRNFLTGSALMMIVDLLFLGVFVAVMFSYAAKLTFIVIATLVIFGILWLCIGPFLRKRVLKQYERNADNTAFLTESVTGIETIKTLGMGDRFAREWEEKFAASLKATLNASMLGHWAGGSIGLVQKLSSAIILWFGVNLVLDGDLTVGQLVAFNMLSGHVTMPILRLAQIWQDFQHTGISIRRIGDILNEKPDAVVSAGRSSLDRVKGGVELRKVTFRYTPDGPEVLRRLDLQINPGEVIGITGLSGSGKSTITKLIQRLYVPQSGQVLVDNVDLAMADRAMLRRRMGVVLQESFLFNGSIKENIALANPSASAQEMQRAIALSGVDSFAEDLPQKYETQVGERGSNLSGGQRQRVAIARALIADPQLLIFDEATSALDYETEAGILRKLPEIVNGRTVIMIAHRLNCMPLCDRVFVMDKGTIIEEGTHDDLLEKNGPYAKLWALQNEGVTKVESETSQLPASIEI